MVDLWVELWALCVKVVTGGSARAPCAPGHAPACHSATEGPAFASHPPIRAMPLARGRPPSAVKRGASEDLLGICTMARALLALQGARSAFLLQIATPLRRLSCTFGS